MEVGRSMNVKKTMIKILLGTLGQVDSYTSPNITWCYFSVTYIELEDQTDSSFKRDGCWTSLQILISGNCSNMY